MDDAKLRTTLEAAEGKRARMYWDGTGMPVAAGPEGTPTVGIGRNMLRPLSDAVIGLMYQEDTQAAHQLALTYFAPDFAGWTDARQRAIVETIFNLGAARFAEFVRTIAALRCQNWPLAAHEMRDSAWFEQLPTRVSRIARMIETGSDRYENNNTGQSECTVLRY